MKCLATPRTLTVACLVAMASIAQADPIYHPPGPNLTYGAVSNGQTIMSDITNPAAGAAALKKDGNQYRFGILSSIGVGVEFGKVDNLYDRIDAEAQAFQSLQSIGSFATPAEAVAEIDARLASLNSLLADVETNGYGKAFGSAHLPVMPLVITHQGLGGSLVLDVNGSVAARVTAYNDPVNFNSTAALSGTDDPTDDINLAMSGGIPSDFQINSNNDSTVLVKAARVAEMTLGYSRPFLETEEATLYGGLRARYYKVETSRDTEKLGNLVDGTQNAFDNAFDQNLSSDSGFGIDAGVLWVSQHYRLGATLTNINEPKFDFTPIDLTGYDTSSPVYQKLSANNSYTMDSQLQLEGALYTANQNWVISAGYDVNAVKDVFGDEYQWATVSAAYATDTWFLPGIRAGLRKNMAGTEINYLSLGATFSVVNVDLAWSPDKIDIDGDTVPRGAMLNLGLELTF